MFANTDLLEHQTRLTKFAYKLTRNQADAEDLVQNTLVRAIEKKELFQEGTNLYSWLSKIMYNLFVSAYRRKTKFESQYDPEPYIQKQQTNARQHKEMELQDVDAAVQKLSKDHRSVMILVCIKGMEYAEVAKRLKIPVGTVRSRLSRAREQLQAHLELTPLERAQMAA